MKRKLSPSPVPAASSSMSSRETRGTASKSTIAAASTTSNVPADRGSPSIRRSNRVKQQDYSFGTDEWPLQGSSSSKTTNGVARKTRSFDEPVPTVLAVSTINCSRSNGGLTLNVPDACSRHQSQTNGHVGVQEEDDDYKPEDDSKDMKQSFFGNHVRFSPTTKSSSPTRRMDETRSRRQAANIARVRLQNLPSEDEQSEFGRRYSRDLRKRRRIQQEQLDFLPEPDTPNGSPILRVTRGMTGSVGKKSVRQVIDHDMADEESMSDQERPVHASRPGRRVAQQTRYFDDSYSMLDEDDQKIIVASTKVSGVTASTTTRTVRKVSHGNDDAKSDADEDRDVENDAEDEDEKAEEVGHPQSIRRSSRISTQRRLNVKESSEEDSGEKELRSRPKRNRVPVERLSYNTAKVRSSSRRASYRSDIRNLDQYSSDDEFQAADCRVRRRKYDTRESRSLRSTLKIRPPAANSRDTSSSSSSDGVANVDEQRFVQRKKKRMMIERAKMRPLNMSKDDMLMSVIRDRQKVGSSMADVSPMEVDTLVTFDSVGGSAEHINSLKEMVVLPLLYPELFSKFSITPPRGVLFHGPPGTGKTLLARALVNECSHDGRKVAFFMRKGADCLSKWIGESERQLRLLFDQAYLMRPSVIFFDEIDGLAPVRSSRNDQIHSSIVSTLLALLDGLDSRGEIVVIGATNRIENIDPALRRPGRFDRELRFTLPTRDARKEILTLHTKSWSPPVSDAMLNDLAESTIGYCGADLKGLCAEAALVALKRSYPQVYFTNQKLALDIEQVIVCQEDFVQAMKSMVPSTHRIYDQAQAPLPKTIRPLLSRQVTRLCEKLEKTLPIQSSTASGNPLLSTTSVLGSYRPRLLIFGQSGQGLTTYVGPAVLHYLEKLPCHKLDIPTLFSNSARCPEESLLYTIQEARRTAPSVLYIPHLIRFWHNVMTESLKHTFLSLISDIQPTAPLLILAIAEIDQAHPDTASDPTDCSTNIIHQLFQPEEVFVISDADREERAAFFQPLFDVASAPVEESMSEKASKPLGPLQVLPVADSRELTSKEEQRLRRKEESLLRELRIFLRDIWNKINREQKFFMFRQPVDTEEVDDYLDIVKQPMDFDQMLCKLDDGQYNCAQDFLNDINLIAQNAILYNSDHHYETNRVICHRAKALQDFAYALVKAEMDTDFEDECKEISARRKKLTSVLNQEPSVNTAPASGSVTTTPTSATPGVACPTDLKSDGTLGSGGTASSDTLKGARRHKRRSLWSKGYVGSSRARKKPDTESLSPVIVNDTMNGCSSDEGSHYNDGASDVESPEKSTMPPRQPLILDDSGMEKFRAELLERTAHCHVEVLEKLFTRMMTCFQTGFKNKTDRTSLPTHLQGIMSSVLEPASRGFLEIANSKL